MESRKAVHADGDDVGHQSLMQNAAISDSHARGSRNESGTHPQDTSVLPPEHRDPTDISSLSPEPEKSRRASRYKYLVCDTWICEIAAICASCLCVIAIGAVLAAYDQRTYHPSRLGLTLNTIVSILATASKASLIYPVTSGISQLKWCWMQKRGRKLQDLRLYDDASRGISGAIAMLSTRSMWSSFASLGAIITILAVAFDPFVQQLLHYPTRQASRGSDTATTKRALKYDASGGIVFSDGSDPLGSNDFVSAINAGLWSHSDRFERNPVCASGNCTWPPFHSVGWCSKCEDITASTTISGCEYTIAADFPPPNKSHELYPHYHKDIPCKISPPQGASVNIPIWGQVVFYPNNSILELYASPPGDVIWMVNGTNASDVPLEGTPMVPQMVLHNYTYMGVKNPLMVFAHASMRLIDTNNPSRGMRFRHVDQCVLSLCSRLYNTSVTNGIPSTNILSTEWGAFEDWESELNRTVYNWNGNTSLGMPPDMSSGWAMYWVPKPKQAGEVVIPVVGGSSYSERFTTIISPSWFDQTTQRIVGNGTIDTWNSFGSGWTTFSAHENGKITSNSFSSDAVQIIASNGLNETISNVAASLTQLGLDKSALTVAGNISVPEIYTDVRWKWFAVPCALELAGIVFLFVTIVISKSQEALVWKSSVYSLLYHGLEQEILDEHPIVDSVSGMDALARSTTVKLRRSNSGERLCLG